ncbi:hypothetical protein E2C01_068562 [Portunus trituberculatus]|uniref:Uncharacterized protein n=1 Tax=Portunus trituberculatus TaxID=210409 RepID=A0A5B7HP54_PORTR|nr:hypothetical protein [Portunus trituberculatus]
MERQQALQTPQWQSQHAAARRAIEKTCVDGCSREKDKIKRGSISSMRKKEQRHKAFECGHPCKCTSGYSRRPLKTKPQRWSSLKERLPSGARAAAAAVSAFHGVWLPSHARCLARFLQADCILLSDRSSDLDRHSSPPSAVC